MSAAARRREPCSDTFALPLASATALVAESIRIVRREQLEAACVVARRALKRLDAMGQGSDRSVEREAQRALRVVFEMIDKEEA